MGARRSRGLLSTARAVDGDAALKRGVQLSECLGQPLLLGRALLAQGTVARRAKRKRDADDALAHALEVSSKPASQRFAERARAERTRIGLYAPAPRAN